MFTSSRALTVLAALALTAAPAVTALAATHSADAAGSAAPAIAPAVTATTATARATTAAYPRFYRERHPEIRRAINALQHARSDLQNAATDFGGHRADALAATDNAIRQLQLALQYDR